MKPRISHILCSAIIVCIPAATCIACSWMFPPIPRIVGPYVRNAPVGQEVSFDGRGCAHRPPVVPCMYYPNCLCGSYDADDVEPWTEVPAGGGYGIRRADWWFDPGPWQDDIGLMTSHSWSTPGQKLVKLWVVDNEWVENDMFTTALINVVAVDKIRVIGTSNEGPVFIRPGMLVYLVAEPTPDYPFPEGCPVWAIESCPTGAAPDVDYTYPPDQSQVTLSNLTVPGNYVVRAECGTSSDTITVTIVEVTNVVWETYGTNTALDTCAKNGGSRIFPDKQTPNDGGAANRQKVTVKATLSANVGTSTNVYVTFRCWDVDDPSANSAPIDPNDNDPDPNERSKDNRAPFYFSVGSSDTICLLAQGSYVTTTFEVSTRPGDNYRITATTRDINPPPLTHYMVETGNLPSDVKRTPMLTTWRKLHVEFDTMDSPPASEPFGVISGTSQKITNPTLWSQGSPSWPADKLEGAVLDPDGTGAPSSVNYVGLQTFEIAHNASNNVTILSDYRSDRFDNDGINGRDDSGEVFTMSQYAADPSNDPYSINTDDPKWRTALNPPSASSVISGMNGYYNDAYMQVVEQTTGNTHSSFGWDRMTDDQRALVDVAGDGQYWCVTVGWAYESADKKKSECPETCTDHKLYAGDDDPEDEGVTDGYRVSTYGWGELSGERCMIFCEIQRDRGDLDIDELVSHEVGHCLGVEHSVYNPATGFESTRDGIMGWEDTQGYYPCKKAWRDLTYPHSYPDRFSYQHIDLLRSYATD